ncbi:MAG: 50S ribosomal protein L9 [Opitutales bacterium]
MANQQLLLLEPVENLGNEGDQVTVRAGYARNFLLPQGRAIPVTRANIKQIESLRRRAEERLAKQLEGARAKAGRIEKLSIVFAVKTGPGGKMFGSITAADIVNRVGEEDVELDRKQVTLGAPVKTLGQHTAKIKLHPEVTVELAFEVVSENPIEELEGEEAAPAETTEA